MQIKEVTIKLDAFILITGLNSYEIFFPDDQQLSAKEYFKAICPNYLGCKYLGYNRFRIKYDEGDL